MNDLNARLQRLTPEKRALLLAQLAKKARDNAPKTGISRRSDLDSYPLSFAQQRLWFFDQLEPNSALYNISGAVRLRGPLDQRVLELSLNQVIQRHETLRSSYIVEEGQSKQIVSSDVQIVMPLIDLRSLPREHRELEALRVATEDAQRPFDLGQCPLLRASLLKIDDQEHIVVLSMHHIVSDGWSIGIMLHEMAALYDAAYHHRPPSLPELPIQYADFAQSQRDHLQGEVLAKLLAYWKGQLGDHPPVVTLPTDRPRPPVQTYKGAHFEFNLSTKLTEQLRNLSRAEGVTLFMTTLAAFNVLLYRYTRQDDISVGSPFANRGKIELEGLIGFFVNMLVLRTDLSGTPSFRELLQRVRLKVQEAQDYQDLPFEMLVAELQPERDSSYSPLFQVALVFQTPPPALSLGDIDLELIATDIGTSKLDISWVVEDNGRDGLRCAFRYNTDLFDPSTIERLADHIQVLLNAIVSNPNQSIAALPLLDKVDRQSLLADWNRTQVQYPLTQAIHQCFEEQVAQTPDAIALHFIPTPGANDHPEEQVSYAELNKRANQVAYYLRGLGVGPETLVGLCMERSPEMIVGLLGILKAGGAYLPLDPDYPPERLKFMIKDSGINLLLTLSSTEIIHSLEIEDLPVDGDFSLVYLDSDWPDIASQPDENPANSTKPDNLAYVIYTSGSTGTPKGVEVLQRGLINHARAMTDAYEISTGDRVLQFITLSFDAAGEEVYPALISGSTLVLVGSAAELVGGRLIHFCAEHDIHVLHLAASIWHQSVDDLSARSETMNAPLKVLLVGGERPDLERLRTWSNLLQQPLRFINAYGPTETTITASKFEMVCDAENVAQLDRIPIGKPIANVQTYILDDYLEPTPVGVPGELYIAGAGVARGYRGRPDLTEQRFVPDPFTGKPAARLYKTGDLVRRLPDGNIEFLGRVDEQVKIRGFRIELGEIESVLGQQSSVGEAAVIVREDVGHKRLVAYLVSKDGQLDIRGLHSALQERLPEYMLPATYVPLEEMPRLPNGKINRRALPEPIGERHLGDEYVAPRDTLEEYLVEMWCGLVGVEQIGVHDNFFELGGNSILGATFVNRLQDRLDEYVYLVALFDAPSVAALATYLRENYPVGVARMLGEDEESIAQTVAGIDRPRVISDKDLAKVRELIVPLSLPAYEHSPDEAQNPTAVFLLSAPRSGSTLSRVILGGNPKLFSPPELQLLNYNTLEEQQKALGTERDDFWLDGIRRAIMELQDCDIDEARAIFQAHIDRKLTVKQFYGVMQSWLGDRIFVDKTPNYALDPNMLRKAEEDFVDAKYIHLIRHPYAMIPSFEKAKLHVFYPPFLREEHDFTPGQLAELIWVISHQNIIAFLGGIPQERQLRITYEDLVQQPRHTVGEICRFLNIEIHPDMLEPQKNPKQRMTDGIHPLARMVGDVRFFEHKGIDGRNAYRWKEKLEVDYLGDVTWELAEHLGYERLQGWPRATGAKSLSNIQKQPRVLDSATGTLKNLPLSFAQERLWFLHQMQPDSADYNVPVALRFQGDLDIAALEHSLNAIIRRHEVLHTVFPSVGGRSALRLRPEIRISLQVEDLQERPDPSKYIKRIISNEAKKPFDLSVGPLLRARVLKVAADEHIFLLSVHHIVADGQSMAIFVHEVAALYRSAVGEQDIILPDLPIQYPDYAIFQREWLQGAVAQRQLAYWKHQLAECPPLLHLSTDYPRPQEQTNHGTFETFQLPPDLVVSLKKLGREQSATLFMTLMAAFQVLLYRYSGQQDFNVGTPVAGRNRSEIEQLIGFFVNTLVLRADLTEQPSFRALLDRVRDTTVGAFAHQDLPFEMLVDELQPQRDMSHSPLFQVMFVLQDAPADALQLPGLSLTPLPTDTGAAKFDLTLSITDTGQGLHGLMEYNTDLFERETISRMINHFIRLLAAITADPDQFVATLPMLSQSEYQKQIVDWNDNQIEYPNLCIHDLFSEQVERSPDATALIFASPEHGEEASMTYSELNRRANQVAHHLLSLGVEPDQMVALMMQRSMEMIVGLLGVLKAGAAYVPIDPTYPQNRISYMLQDAQTPVVLTQQDLIGKVPLNGHHVVCLDRDWPHISRHADTEPASAVTPNNLAYVIYTSGSTGQPKGVMIPHSALVNHALSMVDAYELDGSDRMLQFITLSFDAAGEEIYPALIGGASLVLIPSAAELVGAPLFDFLERHRITILHAPAAAWHQSLDARIAAGRSFHGILRVLLLGGERPNVERLCIWAENWGQPLTFINAYGPTEVTISATYFKIPCLADALAGLEQVPIGRPLPNVQIYVLDENRQPTPVGVPGELFVGGAGVARGYLNRPELTQKSFVPDPFSEDPTAKLYRTGDLVRYLPDGQLEFLGRADNQIKIRGFRVELAEIEAVMIRHPHVSDAVVLAQENDGHKRLIGYAVIDGNEIGQQEMVNFLSEQLPPYMVPSAYVFMESLPLLPNGKVDRHALPSAEITRTALATDFVAPATPAEQKLAGIWSDLLGIEEIGVHDNFFELGGDSILSIQVVSRAQQAGLHFQAKQLFQFPTVAGLAAVASEAAAIHAEQGRLSGDVPLIPIQYWFFDLGLPSPHHWNQSILLEVPTPLPSGQLRLVIDALLEHHDALRMRFRFENGTWLQTMADVHDEAPIEVVELTETPDAKLADRIEQIATRAQMSLDLQQGPLLRAVYMDLGPHRSHRLLLVIHHLVVDGVSWRILTEDLQTAFAQVNAAAQIMLPPKTTSFRQWAERLQSYSASDSVSQQIDYWHSIQSEDLALLPVDFPTDVNDEASAASISAILDQRNTQVLLQDIPAVFGSDVNEALLSCLLLAFNQWTGSSKLLLEQEGHGREDLFADVNLARSVGWFTSMYPLLLTLPMSDKFDGGPWRSPDQVISLNRSSLQLTQPVAASSDTSYPVHVLQDVHEQVQALPQKGIGYGLLRYLHPDQDVRSRLAVLSTAQVSFNYLGRFDTENQHGVSPINIAPENRGPERDHKGLRQHLMEISVSIVDGMLKLNWRYSRNLHRQETIQTLVDDFMAALHVLIEQGRTEAEKGYARIEVIGDELSYDDIDALMDEIEF